MSFDPKQERIKDRLLDINERRNFKPVDLGFNKEDALKEANRCLQCANPSCVEGCPIHLPIKTFIALIREDRINQAYQLINNISPFTHVCSQACDYFKQCEGHCIRSRNNQAVSIHNLHRFICENHDKDKIKEDKLNIKNGKKVAIIGSGPAGLSCAYNLYKEGFDVTIYEREKEIGGIPHTQIPSFRVDKYYQNIQEIINETDIKIITSTNLKIDDIYQKYDANVIAIGTSINKKMGISGEDLTNVITSDKFLVDVKNNKIDKNHKNVFVVGGGNVAIDCVRTAVRLYDNVSLVYRRSLQQAPARKDEIAMAEEEGVNLLLLNNPVSFIGKDKLEKIELIKMSLGELDESGRASFNPIIGSNYILDADLVILAISSTAEKNSDLIKVGRNNLIQVNNYQTNIPNVFACGDVVTGPNTIVDAIKSGIDTAEYIDKYLKR